MPMSDVVRRAAQVQALSTVHCRETYSQTGENSER
jgi:hypothetical protein